MRAVGDATLSFGQVPIPVKVYLAACPTRSEIHLITPEGHRVALKYFDCQTGKEVKRSDLRKGVEVSKGKYATLSRSEWETVAGKKKKIIEVCEVVPPQTISAHRVRKSYYLLPDKSDKPYHLLQRLLHHQKQYMVGKWYTRAGHDHCVVIQPVGLVLLMSLVYYPKECRDMTYNFPSGCEATPHEVHLAQNLLDLLVRPSVQWDDYTDEWQTRLDTLLAHKHGQSVNLERLLRRSLKRKR